MYIDHILLLNDADYESDGLRFCQVYLNTTHLGLVNIPTMVGGYHGNVVGWKTVLGGSAIAWNTLVIGQRSAHQRILPPEVSGYICFVIIILASQGSLKLDPSSYCNLDLLVLLFVGDFLLAASAVLEVDVA